MNNQQIRVLCSGILCLFMFSLKAQQKTQAPPIQYRLELAKSKILWKAPKNHGGSNHSGFLLFTTGHMLVAVDGTPSSATFTINMNSISSTDHKTPKENERLNLQIKSPDFFDVARYPKAIMVVKKIVPTTTPSVFAITGDLTMKNVTNTIYFTATIKKINDQFKVTGDFKIDRMKWNVKNMEGDFFGGVKNMLIEEDIPISLDLLFVKI